MKEKWMQLFADFEESGYKPSDIKRIVMVYEMTRENDEMLKELFAGKQKPVAESSSIYSSEFSIKGIN